MISLMERWMGLWPHSDGCLGVLEILVEIIHPFHSAGSLFS